ncbi:hypothetical protein CHS0354_036403 [Potamilus streckersoni]|uniref:Uncharacterized protein n=1 Tax=Potamilus streckersoni TaxID=2493646 RepID=A0AAE0SWG6_9BIVA|nr:hypothetical protein CHS0354_036403 [Potamilus streckersoni]
MFDVKSGRKGFEIYCKQYTPASGVWMFRPTRVPPPTSSSKAHMTAIAIQTLGSQNSSSATPAACTSNPLVGLPTLVYTLYVFSYLNRNDAVLTWSNFLYTIGKLICTKRMLAIYIMLQLRMALTKIPALLCRATPNEK